MTALLSWYGALADAHPRAVFTLAALFGSAGALSLAMGGALGVAAWLSERDERAEG